MDSDQLRELGYGHLVDLRQQGKCPYCEKLVDMSKLNTLDILKEYEISGMCAECYERIGRNMVKFAIENPKLTELITGAIIEKKVNELRENRK